jgi:hypothetical protein
VLPGFETHTGAMPVPSSGHEGLVTSHEAVQNVPVNPSEVVFALAQDVPATQLPAQVS